MEKFFYPLIILVSCSLLTSFAAPTTCWQPYTLGPRDISMVSNRLGARIAVTVTVYQNGNSVTMTCGKRSYFIPQGAAHSCETDQDVSWQSANPVSGGYVNGSYAVDFLR